MSAAEWEEVTALRSQVEDLQALLKEAAMDAHQMGQLFSGGVLHPGPYESCRAMSCERYREAHDER